MAHAPVRLSIVAALAGVDEAEFGHVRDTIEVTGREAYARHLGALRAIAGA